MRHDLAPQHRLFARALTLSAVPESRDHAVRELLAIAGHDRQMLETALDHGRVLSNVVGPDEVCDRAIRLVKDARARLGGVSTPA